MALSPRRQVFHVPSRIVPACQQAASAGEHACDAPPLWAARLIRPWRAWASTTTRGGASCSRRPLLPPSVPPHLISHPQAGSRPRPRARGPARQHAGGCRCPARSCGATRPRAGKAAVRQSVRMRTGETGGGGPQQADSRRHSAQPAAAQGRQYANVPPTQSRLLWPAGRGAWGAHTAHRPGRVAPRPHRDPQAATLL